MQSGLLSVPRKALQSFFTCLPSLTFSFPLFYRKTGQFCHYPDVPVHNFMTPCLCTCDMPFLPIHFPYLLKFIILGPTEMLPFPWSVLNLSVTELICCLFWVFRMFRMFCWTSIEEFPHCIYYTVPMGQVPIKVFYMRNSFNPHNSPLYNYHPHFTDGGSWGTAISRNSSWFQM